MEIVPKKRATPSEGGWLARRGCHLDENSRVMGELVPKPLTPSSSPVSSSSSSLSDVRSGDQDQGLGSRITQTLFHCFCTIICVSNLVAFFILFLSMCTGGTNKPSLGMFQTACIWRYYQAGWDCFYTYAQFRAVLSCPYDRPTGRAPCVSRHAHPGPPNFLPPTRTPLSGDQWRQQSLFFNICSNLSLSSTSSFKLIGRYKIAQRQED